MSIEKIFHLLTMLVVLGTIAEVHGQSTADGKVRTSKQFPARMSFIVEYKRMTPAKRTVKSGYYEIFVENAIVQGDLEVVLDKGSTPGQSSRLSSRKVSKRARRTRFVEYLGVGEYRVSVVGMPEWSSLIVVTENK